MSPKDRREYPRLDGRFEVHVLNMGDDPTISPWEIVVKAQALDVSMKGMRLKASYDVPVGSFLSAIVYYRGHESICLCEIVWKSDAQGEFLYGLSLQEWTQLDRALDHALRTMEGEPSSTIS